MNQAYLVTSSVRLTEKFERALVTAHRLHFNQQRKTSGVPYIAHLLSVAALVLEDGGDEDEAIAALLHDAIEDQGGAKTRELIRQQFGDRVVTIVDGCTESDIQPKPPWKERKLAYLEHLRHASPSVLRVALADKVHNVSSLLFDLTKYGKKTWDCFSVGKEETLWFYREVFNVTDHSSYSLLRGKLEQLLLQLETLQRSQNN